MLHLLVLVHLAVFDDLLDTSLGHPLAPMCQTGREGRVLGQHQAPAWPASSPAGTQAHFSQHCSILHDSQGHSLSRGSPVLVLGGLGGSPVSDDMHPRLVLGLLMHTGLPPVQGIPVPCGRAPPGLLALPFLSPGGPGSGGSECVRHQHGACSRLRSWGRRLFGHQQAPR